MRVFYAYQEVVDCTSDPHLVQYGTGEAKQVLEAMFRDMVRVCESELIMGVRSVQGILGDTYYTSPRYEPGEKAADQNGDQKAEGVEAERHRVAGLYFYHGPAWGPWRGGRQELSPGLTGIKEFVAESLAQTQMFQLLKIGVVWTFAGEAACSDYIEAGDYFEPLDFGTVNYGSTSWWKESEHYEAWCRQMAEFLNKPFPHAHGTARPGDSKPNLNP